jgi:hypothetical protein
MKLIFFLIAFCLITIRIYFSWAWKDKENRGVSESNMVIKGDHFYEEIKYSGKFQLTDDETGFKSISPGGYYKFIKNEKSVKAESNLKGEIDYTISDGKNYQATDEPGKKLIAEAVKEMIYQGFDANARMERIYRKGGSHALLSEIDSMRIDPVKIMYLDRLLTIDSLSPDDPNSIGKILDVSKRIGSDMDKANLYNKIIDKGLITGVHFDSLLVLISNMGSDMDKENLYKNLIKEKDISEAQWIRLIDKATQLSSDMDKSNLLLEIAQKMPRTETVKTSYLKAAKSINDDNDFGKTVRAVE